MQFFPLLMLIHTPTGYVFLTAEIVHELPESRSEESPALVSETAGTGDV
jgi:hypothetical protein